MSNALTIAPNIIELVSRSDLEILRDSKFKDFTANELSYAHKISNSLQLNPLLNQVHFVKRGRAITTQVGIDGFRLIAQRTGQYAGSDEVAFEVASDKPIKASVTVYRMISGQRCAFTASARWLEYKPESADHMWRKMPFTMLGKCAEALALRKAFPAELSGVYAAEEMQQADNPSSNKVESLNARAIEPEYITSESDFGDYVCQVGKRYVGKKLKEIPAKDLKDFCNWILDLEDASESLLEFKRNADLYLNQ